MRILRRIYTQNNTVLPATLLLCHLRCVCSATNSCHFPTQSPSARLTKTFVTNKSHLCNAPYLRHHAALFDIPCERLTTVTKHSFLSIFVPGVFVADFNAPFAHITPVALTPVCSRSPHLFFTPTAQHTLLALIIQSKLSHA